MTHGRVFISYAWCKDSLGRSNYHRVQKIGNELKMFGWKVWIDSDCLGHGNIDAVIMEGIENTDIFIACITREYCTKIQSSLINPLARDSCAKEWSCAMIRNKMIQPIIMEPELRNVPSWPHGVVTAQLGNNMWVDCSQDVESPMTKLHYMLLSLISSKRGAQNSFYIPKPILPPIEKTKGVTSINPYPPLARPITPNQGGFFGCRFPYGRIKTTTTGGYKHPRRRLFIPPIKS